MISVGVDIGSSTTKAVLLDGDEVRGRLVVPSGNLPGKTAEEVLRRVLDEAGVSRDRVDVIATTGYGRRLVDLGDIVMTEIKACALGALRAAPGGGEPLHTVIDVGGQDTKVMALADDGDIEDFSMNDKCAAGTGRFLEMLAAKLEMTYEDFVSEATRSDTMIQMNATCAVFAESEVVGLLARGVSKADIAAAAHNSIAARVASMVRRVGQRGAYAFVGGGALNAALVAAVEEVLNRPLHVPENAQSVVAFGAAVGAQARLARMREKEKAGQ
ncbi:MAG: acyl-CoA dehydratase activase [Planctomycetota bacterium]|jgi:predicted CoA-substrate-specific enzyme activase